eukprot:850154_1
MNWFVAILLAFISTNATKYEVMVEYAKTSAEDLVYGYVKVYGYGDKEKIESTKTIDKNNDFDEWDETFIFDEIIDNYGKYESFRFELYDSNEELVGETGKIWIEEIKDCDKWYSMQLTIILGHSEVIILYIAISKTCDIDSSYGEILIIPNDILNPSDPQFPENEALNAVYGRLSLSTQDGETRIKGKIYGLSSDAWHGFHVHEFGDLTSGCYSTGGHYNPFHQTHGKPKNIDHRHVGDLGNIYADEDGIADVDIVDPLVQLTGQNNVIGRAIVIHEGADNLRTDPTGDAGGRPACGLIGIIDDYKLNEYSSGKTGGGEKITDKASKSKGKDKEEEKENYDEEIIRATCVLLPNENELFDEKGVYKYDNKDEDMIRGFLNIEIKDDNYVIIVGEISGLEPNSIHGFHIHEYGNITDSCTSTGGHFNPYDLQHGGPNDKERHIGDLGNIEANDRGIAFIDITDEMVKLNGDVSVIGRAFVVHEGEDDLKTDPTGGAGNRLACGVIGIAEIKVDEKY